jgi:hypothetical protein
MLTATTGLSQWIRLEKTSQTHFENEEMFGRNMESTIQKTPMNLESVLGFGQQAYSPDIPGAQWFKAIQQKIAVSTIPPGYEPGDPGSWLTPQVAVAALTFLFKSSYEFATEPYLDRSPSGELVAEFREGEARWTFIISPDSVTAFSVVEGKPIFKERPIRYWSTNQLKFWREKTLAQPSRKIHGSMGS